MPPSLVSMITSERTQTRRPLCLLYGLLFAKLHLLDPNLTLFKSDVSKAHRRIKVLKKHCKYMVAKIKDKFWVNKVGTYGVASVQLYWG